MQAKPRQGRTNALSSRPTLLRMRTLGDPTPDVLEGRASPVPDTQTPHISIVIPVYNEEAILHAAVVDLRERLKPMGWAYEIILAENGSRDRTVEIGQELASKYEEVKIISL